MRFNVNPQTVEDPVTGLKFEFRVHPETGGQLLTVTRFDKGIPGIQHRDLCFSPAGDHDGAGSAVGGCELPINPPEPGSDPADYWKE